MTDYPPSRVKTAAGAYSTCLRSKGKFTLYIHIYGIFEINKFALMCQEGRTDSQSNLQSIGEHANSTKRPLIISSNHCTIMSPFNFRI